MPGKLVRKTAARMWKLATHKDGVSKGLYISSRVVFFGRLQIGETPFNALGGKDRSIAFTICATTMSASNNTLRDYDPLAHVGSWADDVNVEAGGDIPNPGNILSVSR